MYDHSNFDDCTLYNNNLPPTQESKTLLHTYTRRLIHCSPFAQHRLHAEKEKCACETQSNKIYKNEISSRTSCARSPFAANFAWLAQTEIDVESRSMWYVERCGFARCRTHFPFFALQFHQVLWRRKFNSLFLLRNFIFSFMAMQRILRSRAWCIYWEVHLSHSLAASILIWCKPQINRICFTISNSNKVTSTAPHRLSAARALFHQMKYVRLE